MRSWENKPILFSMFLVFFPIPLLPISLFSSMLCKIQAGLIFTTVWNIIWIWMIKYLYHLKIKLLMDVYMIITLLKKKNIFGTLDISYCSSPKIFLPEEMITFLISVTAIRCLFIFYFTVYLHIYNIVLVCQVLSST